MLRLMYAMAIMRLVNGVVDQSKKLNSMSVALRAEAAKLPRMLVDIRHEVAHKELPSLSYLQLASKQALEWLKVHYWEAQKQLSSTTLKEVSEYDNTDEMCRRSSDPSDTNTARYEQGIGYNSETSTMELQFERSESALLDARKRLQSLCKGKSTMLCTNVVLNREVLENELERGESELLEVRKRLQLLCKGKDIVSGTNGARPSEAAFPTTHQGKSSQKVDADEHAPLKGMWTMPDTWRPCAIGKLPSAWHPAGVLPCFESNFRDLASQTDMPEVELPNKAEDQVDTAAVDIKGKTFDMDPACMRLKRNLLENDIEETPAKRIRAENGADTSNRQGDGCWTVLVPSNSIPSSKGFAQDSRIGPVEKLSSSNVQGVLLLDGLYQRCGSEQLAAIESAIQVFK